MENHHENGILHWSLAPAPGATADLQRSSSDYALRVLNALEYIGVLAIEFFQRDGRLIANETAPRVHNSGHWTLEGAETSQFENHLRTVVGWPLGSTAALGCSVMLNLIGAAPAVETILAIPEADIHLYGKAPRPGRKLGHVTLRAVDAAKAHATIGEGAASGESLTGPKQMPPHAPLVDDRRLLLRDGVCYTITVNRPMTTMNRRG